MLAICHLTLFFLHQKKLEDELTAYGMKLMNPPSSTDDIINLLDKVESLLIMVGQCPCDSTRSALQPVKKALIMNELLRHTNEDVKVSVVSCITELCRITAPHHPYDDHEQMEEILQHTVMALKKLADVSGRSYCKVVQILENVAKLRVCVMLLDLEYNTLVIEIFKLFLGIIRPYHPHNVFTKMEEIMTQLIEDSDELSVELLWPLLDSVKKENQIASPVSSKLGEKVLEDCAAIIKPYLAEALKSMSLNPDDCADFVASICSEMPKGGEIMANDNAPDAVHSVKVIPSEAKFCEPALQDDTHGEKLKDTCNTCIMKPDNPEDVQPATNAEVSSRSNKLTGNNAQHSLASENHNISTGSHGHWGQPKKKDSPMSEDAQLGVLVPTGNVLQSQDQKKKSLHLGFTWGERTKRKLCAKRKPGRDSRKNQLASDCDPERKSESGIKNEGNIKEHKEPSLLQIDGMKQLNNEITIKMHNIEESGDKATKSSVIDENHLNNCASYKSGRKLATRKHEITELSVRDENHLNKCANYKPGKKLDTCKHKDSKRPRTIKSCGEELVGARIKIWWPLEEKFYEAAVSSFDPVKKRHTVVYVDGDVELLKLYKERWKMLEDNSFKKDSERPSTIKYYGEELVGARIKIWWPLDEKFYDAAVSSFDPVKKQHRVIYVDGDIEILTLDKERWEFLEDNSSQEGHGLDFQGHADSSVTRTSKKKAKINSSTGPNVWSSKRSTSTAK